MQENKQSIYKRIEIKLRSIIFCFRYLTFRQAIHVPIIVCNPIKTNIKGEIILDYDMEHEKVVIAGGGSFGLQEFVTGLLIEKKAKLILHGGVFISEGTVIRIDSGGLVEIGEKSYINKNNYLRSANTIKIGSDVVIGWNNTFNTTDGHIITVEGHKSKPDGDILIGNHCWITTYCTIGKNVVLADNTIVAQKSLVLSSFGESNCLLGGIPAKILKNKVNWIR